jgi:hypothetical protein
MKWQKFAVGATLAPVIEFGGERGYHRLGCQILGWREPQGLGL